MAEDQEMMRALTAWFPGKKGKGKARDRSPVKKEKDKPSPPSSMTASTEDPPHLLKTMGFFSDNLQGPASEQEFMIY